MSPAEFELLLVAAESAFHFGAWLRILGTSETRWSSGMYRLLGLNPSTPSSHELFLSAVHPDDRYLELQTSAPAARQRTGRHVRVRGADTGYRRVISYVRTVAGPDGAPGHQLGLLLEADPGVSDSKFARNLLSKFGHHAPPFRDRFAGLTSVVDLNAHEPLAPALVRAARGMLGWTIQDLAEASKLSISTIRRVEDPEGVGASEATASIVRRTFEKHGLRFIGQGASVGLMGIPDKSAPDG